MKWFVWCSGGLDHGTYPTRQEALHKLAFPNCWFSHRLRRL